MSQNTTTEPTIRFCRCAEFADMVCGRTTGRIWAPGHDARIKGYLQRMHREDLPVALTDGTEVTARQAAEEFIPALVPFLYYKRGSMAARFADDHAALAASAVARQIKVGRWVYNALVAGDTVTYVTKQGEAKTLPINDAQFVEAAEVEAATA